MNTTPIEIGRLLRSSLTGFVAGCRVDQPSLPVFGTLVRVPIEDQLEAFGLVYDIHMDDDGLVRQLATSHSLPPEVIADNRNNRNMPVEISIITVGRRKTGILSHLLPGHPPVSLDVLYRCTSQEVRDFTTTGRLGYFRHILRAEELPVGELLAAHLEQARAAHRESGDPAWFKNATRELITLLRDDYPTLMSVLNALSDLGPE
ncbi:MAG: hypothetical protein JW704_00405 [Anaerolineaceae bacterium]|nr:hypothetical protein [Anaerolineaceae bacterium]MBN2678388.1 hypothetical protein [Anaerolineaceae bacterium]